MLQPEPESSPQKMVGYNGMEEECSSGEDGKHLKIVQMHGGEFGETVKDEPSSDSLYDLQQSTVEQLDELQKMLQTVAPEAGQQIAAITMRTLHSITSEVDQKHGP